MISLQSRGENVINIVFILLPIYFLEEMVYFWPYVY